MTPPGAGISCAASGSQPVPPPREKEVDEIVWDPLEHPDLGRPRQIAGDALCGDLAVPPPARGGATLSSSARAKAASTPSVVLVRWVTAASGSSMASR